MTRNKRLDQAECTPGTQVYIFSKRHPDHGIAMSIVDYDFDTDEVIAQRGTREWKLPVSEFGRSDQRGYTPEGKGLV